MLTNTGGDILRQYALDIERYPEIIELLEKLFEYGNEIIDVIRTRYNSAYPKNIFV